MIDTTIPKVVNGHCIILEARPEMTGGYYNLDEMVKRQSGGKYEKFLNDHIIVYNLIKETYIYNVEKRIPLEEDTNVFSDENISDTAVDEIFIRDNLADDIFSDQEAEDEFCRNCE